MTEHADVLVVGGGLVGLAAAAMLAHHGVDVVLVERHPSTSRHPKARLVNARSMEIYRALGVDTLIREAGERGSGFVVADTLAAEHSSWIPAEEAVAEDLAAAPGWSCDQQRIEPILRDRAVELGARLRFGTRVTAVDEDGDGVLARVDRGPDVRARFVVAADGARGGLREQWGIGRHGEPIDLAAVSAVFRADLEPALRGRRVEALMARSAGAFLFARGAGVDRSWQLGTYLRPGWDDPACRARGVVEVIRAATGLPDVEPVVEDIQTWTTGAYVADRLRSGRLFLVGDAAHVMPPYGGFGGNTGIHDAHNLAWKLAAACRGDAGNALLDTYASERAPIAERTVAQAMVRSRKVPGQPSPPDQIDSTTIVLGFRHPDRVEDPARPSGEPGTRAAHVGLAAGSVLDLLDPTGFTFVGGTRAAGALDGVRVVVVHPEDVQPAHRDRWEAVYAAPDIDGVLVRPDGVIAWRGRRSEVRAALARARRSGATMA